MTRTRLTRLPPTGIPIAPWRAARRLRSLHPHAALESELGSWSGGQTIALYASGREALRAAFAAAAERSRRHEIVIPAYTCFSVPAAAVAAGCQVRLVDVDEHGWIDRDALARLPLERAAAVVVCNLFGVGEPIADVAQLAEAAGALVLDDAAQSAGASSAEGEVGRRGVASMLSFGRGKPMGAIGGGALLGFDAAAPPDAVATGRLTAWLRVLGWDVALSGVAFRALAAIPALRIGETPFEPGFPRGGLSPEAAALAALALETFDQRAARRRSEALLLAGQVKAAPGWTPLLARSGERGVYPRLAVRAPTAAARDAAMGPLTRLGAGASAFYPSSLDDVAALVPHRAGSGPMPGARDLAARILTLPTHGRLRRRRLDEAIGILARAVAQ